MAEQIPTEDEWRRLYEAATKVKQLGPWNWMFEDQVFGVRNPETGETGFVSTMGMAGQHFSVTLYPDAAALYTFLELEEDAQFGGNEVEAERVLEIPQLQASFEDRDYLSKKDRDIIKKLGLKFRGSNSWPMFRSYTPGLLPWDVTGAEARFLTYGLEQLLDVAPRVQENEDILVPTDNDKDFLVRVSRKEKGNLIWEDEIINIPQPAPPSIIEPQLDRQQVGQLKMKPLGNFSIDFDVRMLLTPVKEQGRPFFPYLMLVVDSRNGLILGMDMLQPVPSLASMRADIPNKLMRFFSKHEIIPNSIVVRSEWLAKMLSPLTDELNLKLMLSESLPGLDEVFEEMITRLG